MELRARLAARKQNREVADMKSPENPMRMG